MSKFETRFNRHEEALNRFISYLQQNEWQCRRYDIQTDGLIIRSMQEYLNIDDQNIRYKSDLDAYKNGKWFKFDIKASYLSVTGNFSIELASILHSKRHHVIIVGEIRKGNDSQFRFIRPQESYFLWSKIYVPHWRWTLQDKQLLETVYPEKTVVWNRSTKRLGSGTPFVLIHSNKLTTGEFIENN